MSAQKIDVLAVMDSAITDALCLCGHPNCSQMREHAARIEARAAVAELIELGAKVAAHNYTFMPGTQWIDMQAFLAALARIQGGAE